MITRQFFSNSIHALSGRRLWGALAIGCVAAALAMGMRPSDAAAADAKKPIRVLLVTGDEIPVHKWRETAPLLATELRKDPRMDVRMVEDARFLDSEAIHRYDVIVLNYMNWHTPAPAEAARNNLKKAVENGKGLVLFHFACGAWHVWPELKNPAWPEFKNLAGRAWDEKLRAHDRHGKFRVEVAMPEHPIVKGLEAFDTTDELYTCLAGDRPIDVLATARSKVDSKDYPMAFAFDYGKGRVFHCTLGHDVPALANPPVAELYRRGTAWAAGKPVTP